MTTLTQTEMATAPGTEPVLVLAAGPLPQVVLMIRNSEGSGLGWDLPGAPKPRHCPTLAPSLHGSYLPRLRHNPLLGKEVSPGPARSTSL